MRIVSFLPSATEMAYALGLGPQIVGVTHECDYPPEARDRPVVVHSAIETKGRAPDEIDRSVSLSLREGRSVYTVDENLLRELAPDLILTQDLCQVCAPSGNEIGRVLKFLPQAPKILWMTPKSLSDILDNVRELGEWTGRAAEARELTRSLRHRMEAVTERTAGLAHRPRVFCMEWLSPPYCAGHWMAEMVERAGGRDPLARKGEDSVRVAWEAIRAEAPEVLVLTPCGYDSREALEQAPLLRQYPGWEDLPAVQNGRVYAVDANSYFARPGPRVAEGIELLAHLFHPDLFSWAGPSEAYQRVNWGVGSKRRP